VPVGRADRGDRWRGAGRPRVIEDPAVERGRGLLLVQALSLRTGTCRSGAGRLVWADIRWDTRGPVAAQPAPLPSVGAVACPRAAGG
jgi:hypothetical protein